MTKRAKTRITKPPFLRTRSRNTPNVFSVVVNNKVTAKSTGVVTVYDDNTVLTLLAPTSESMTDTVTPGFKKIQADGGIVNSPMTRVSTDYESESGAIAGVNDDPSFTGRQDFSLIGNLGPLLLGLLGSPSPSFKPDNLQNYVNVKALAGMKPGSFMGLVTLAEGHKTLGMLAKPLASVVPLVQYLAQLRRGNVNLSIISKGSTLTINGRKFIRPGAFKVQGPGRLIRVPNSSIVIPASSAISGSVLALNLGFAPLLSDIDAVLHEIPKLHTASRLTSRASASDSQTDSSTQVVDWSIFSIPVKTTTVTTIKVRCSVLYEDMFSIPQDFGMSLYDVPSAFWELTTLSFIVDYIVNVGDYIAALEAMQARKILSSSLVTTIDTVVTRELLGSSTPSVPTWKASSNASGVDTVRSIVKTRDCQLRTPMLAVKPLGKILRPTVIQNTLSLIAQQLIGINSNRKH